MITQSIFWGTCRQIIKDDIRVIPPPVDTRSWTTVTQMNIIDCYFHIARIKYKNASVDEFDAAHQL